MRVFCVIHRSWMCKLRIAPKGPASRRVRPISEPILLPSARPKLDTPSRVRNLFDSQHRRIQTCPRIIIQHTHHIHIRPPIQASLASLSGAPPLKPGRNQPPNHPHGSARVPKDPKPQLTPERVPLPPDLNAD